jgi:hypothetical protein
VISVVAVLLAAPATAGAEPPKELPYDMGQPMPPGYRLEIRPRTALVVSGAVIAATAYGASAIFGARLDEPDAGIADASSPVGGLGFIPVLGPFMIASRNPDGLWWAWALGGMAQVGGLTAVVIGMNDKQRVLVRTAAAGAHVEAHERSLRAARVLIGPGGASVRISF